MSVVSAGSNQAGLEKPLSVRLSEQSGQNGGGNICPGASCQSHLSGLFSVAR